MKFVNYGQNYLDIKTDIDNAIQHTLGEGQLILRKDVEKFEENLAKLTHMKYAVGLNSGTDALFLVLKSLGIGQYDEVITSAHTFKSTVGVIEHLGATPILVDIDEHGLMDIKDVVDKMTSRTRAVIPVSITGNFVDLTHLKKICIPNGIYLIEDACQALGANLQSDYAAFSFYPAKILGAYGDAGALVTNDEKVYNEVKDMRNHFKETDADWGFNSRLDNIQAAILNAKLKHLPWYLGKREALAKKYSDNLRGIGDIVLPYDQAGRVWQDYVIRTSKRDELYDYLKEQGIETMKNEYPFPIVKPIKALEYEHNTLRLPCNPEMDILEVDEVVNAIKRFYAQL